MLVPGAQDVSKVKVLVRASLHIRRTGIVWIEVVGKSSPCREHCSTSPRGPWIIPHRPKRCDGDTTPNNESVTLDAVANEQQQMASEQISQALLATNSTSLRNYIIMQQIKVRERAAGRSFPPRERTMTQSHPRPRQERNGPLPSNDHLPIDGRRHLGQEGSP